MDADAAQDELVTYAVNDGIATLTLNRPEKLNAWDKHLPLALRRAMRRATGDSAARVIILTGAGRAFCAGGDMALLDEIRRSSDAIPPTQPPFDPLSDRDYHGPDSYFPAIGKPIIAAINGPAAGVGLSYALHCDIRIASSTAVFLPAFARLGAIAEHGSAWLLSRIVGLPNALDLLLSARRLDAAEAARIGLVNRVLPHDGFMDGVRDYAAILAANSPRSLAVIKRQIWEGLRTSLGDSTQLAEQEMAAGFLSADFKEGIVAFREKREPRFPSL